MSVSIPGTNINNNQLFGVGDSGTMGFHGYRTSGNSAATTYIHFTADAEIG